MSWILYSGRKRREWRIWLPFPKGPSHARINSSSHLEWLDFSSWIPLHLPPRAVLAFWGALPTFSSNCPPPCPRHTCTPENSPALILLLQPWLAYARSQLNLDLTTSLGRSWEPGCLGRSTDTLGELAAFTLSLNEGTIWWLGWKLNWGGGMISKPKHKETGS